MLIGIIVLAMWYNIIVKQSCELLITKKNSSVLVHVRVYMHATMLGKEVLKVCCMHTEGCKTLVLQNNSMIVLVDKTIIYCH